jgi:predicted flap endonuclease-1-like 5' DNA nuclease
LLLLWIDRLNKRNQQQAGGRSGAGEQGEGGSIILEKDAPIVLVEEAPPAKVEDTPAALAEAAGLEVISQAGAGEGAGEAERDDFTVIEGIGSHISELLHNAGIHTYEQLAQSEPDRIKEILRQKNLNMVDPATWMEQAGLAAKDDWENLKNLQGRLKAGRRE